MSRQSFSHRAVFTGLAVSLAVAVLSALFIYDRYVKTVPRAAAHLPDNVAFALRLDVEQVVTYEPFRKYILKVFERGRRGPEPRVKHLERKTTVELGIDSRELAIAVLPNDEFVILLGGVFRRDEVLEGVKEMLREEGIESEITGRLLTHEPSGVSFSVADDGTFVVGSTESLARAAASVGKVSQDLGYRARLQEKSSLASVYFDASRAGPWLSRFTGRGSKETFLTITGGKPFVLAGRSDVRVPQGSGGKVNEIARFFSMLRAESEGAGVTRQITRADFDSFVAGVARLLDGAMAKKASE